MAGSGPVARKTVLNSLSYRAVLRGWVLYGAFGVKRFFVGLNGGRTFSISLHFSRRSRSTIASSALAVELSGSVVSQSAYFACSAIIRRPRRANAGDDCVDRWNGAVGVRRAQAASNGGHGSGPGAQRCSMRARHPGCGLTAWPSPLL